MVLCALEGDRAVSMPARMRQGLHEEPCTGCWPAAAASRRRACGSAAPAAGAELCDRQQTRSEGVRPCLCLCHASSAASRHHQRTADADMAAHAHTPSRAGQGAQGVHGPCAACGPHLLLRRLHCPPEDDRLDALLSLRVGRDELGEVCGRHEHGRAARCSASLPRPMGDPQQLRT